MYILHIKTCQEEGMCHFPVAIHPLFPDDGSLCPACRPSVGIDPKGFEGTLERFYVYLQIMISIVPESFTGQLLSTLFFIQQEGCPEPEIPVMLEVFDFCNDIFKEIKALEGIAWALHTFGNRV